jgi:hypothetical protein
MEKKTVKDRKGKRLSADTARTGGAAYAPHDKEAERLAENATKKLNPPENDGDERTPEKTIGEIKYGLKRHTRKGT